MQMTGSLSTRWTRLFLLALSATALLAGCGGSDGKPEETSAEQEDKSKPAYERVAILRNRFDQLESSLNEMERDLEIQKKRIDQTRETAMAIKRSLVRGNLKGYSIDTITSDPAILQAIEKHKEKKADDKEKEQIKKKSESKFFSGLVIILIIVFLIVVLAVAWKERTQESPYDITPPPYTPPGEDVPADDEPVNDLDITSSGGYQELGRRDEGDERPRNEGDNQ